MLVTLNYVSRSIQCNDETWCNPMPRMCVYFLTLGNTVKIYAQYMSQYVWLLGYYASVRGQLTKPQTQLNI